jgi:hypothetical protein
MKRAASSSLEQGDAAKKSRVDDNVAPPAPLHINITATMLLQTKTLPRQSKAVPAVRRYVDECAAEYGIALELEKIYVGETEIDMVQSQALVGASTITAECSSTSFKFSDILDMKKEVATMKKELGAQLDLQGAQLQSQGAELEKHKTMLCALAIEKITVLASEVLTASAYQCIGKAFTEPKDGDMVHLFRKLTKSPKVNALLRSRQNKIGVTADTFPHRAVELKTRRNDICHGKPELLKTVERAVQAYVPMLEGVQEAEFAVFVVVNASEFI